MILATRGPQYLDPEENRQKKKLHDILGLSIIYINYLIAVCVCVREAFLRVHCKHTHFCLTKQTKHNPRPGHMTHGSLQILLLCYFIGSFVDSVLSSDI